LIKTTPTAFNSLYEPDFRGHDGGASGVAPGVDSWACAATAKRESANDLMVSDMV